MPITFAVLLWPREGREGEFLAYEDDALALLREHGGRLLSRVRRLEAGDHANPFEIHVIELPDEAARERFEADPRRAALADRREASVAQTVMWRVEDVT